MPSGRLTQCCSFVPQPCTSVGHLMAINISFQLPLPALLARSQRRHSRPLAARSTTAEPIAPGCTYYLLRLLSNHLQPVSKSRPDSRHGLGLCHHTKPMLPSLLRCCSQFFMSWFLQPTHLHYFILFTNETVVD